MSKSASWILAILFYIGIICSTAIILTGSKFEIVFGTVGVIVMLALMAYVIRDSK